LKYKQNSEQKVLVSLEVFNLFLLKGSIQGQQTFYSLLLWFSHLLFQLSIHICVFKSLWVCFQQTIVPHWTNGFAQIRNQLEADPVEKKIEKLEALKVSLVSHNVMKL